MWIDTHTHLDDNQFDSQRARVVARAQQAGVVAMLAVGTTADSSQTCVDLAGRFDAVFAAVGIQPNHTEQAEPDDWERIVRLSGEDRVVAVGETGLDRYWDYSPWAVQQDYFDRHIRLAQRRDLPLIIHMRDCERETVAMLEAASGRHTLRGVMHAFTGSAETAARCIELGLHVSFAGMVTYKKSEELRAVAREIPAERLLVETDCPYLSPHPQRGQRPNEPALIVHTASCLAEVRGVDLATLAAQTTENTRRLFRI